MSLYASRPLKQTDFLSLMWRYEYCQQTCEHAGDVAAHLQTLLSSVRLLAVRTLKRKIAFILG
jgi:hypothetical protein